MKHAKGALLEKQAVTFERLFAVVASRRRVGTTSRQTPCLK